MSVDWHSIVADYFGAKPHPLAPTLAVRDVPLAVELASHSKFGTNNGHATLGEAELFWKEFQRLEMSPDQYREMLDLAAPHSFSLHGRPPTMNEIGKFKEVKLESRPKAVADYYYHLPDKHFPAVPAGEMLKHLMMAKPYAEQHIGRKPVKLEAARFYHSGFQSTHIEDHYKQLGAEQSAVAEAAKADQPQAAETAATAQGGPDGAQGRR